MENINKNEIFCQYCPCAGYCDGNAEGNEKATGYSFIPDPDFCKEKFKKEKEITYETFFTAIMEIHGSTVNSDWKRFCKTGGDNDDRRRDESEISQ